MANPYSFTQIATILNTIVAGAQGRNANPLETPVDTSQFVALAQRGLTCGTDALTRSMTADRTHDFFHSSVHGRYHASRCG